MKRTLFLMLSCLFAVALTSKAQFQMPSAEERAKQEVESMKTACKLTEDQCTKVEEISLTYAKKQEEMFQQGGGPGGGGNFEEMRTKMQEMQTQKRNDFDAVLSDEQMKQYDEMLAEQRRNRPGPPQ